MRIGLLTDVHEEVDTHILHPFRCNDGVPP